MTSRRWVPAILTTLFVLPSPALACRNVMLDIETRDGWFSFMVAMTAIVAVSMILRPVIDGAGAFKGVLAAWLTNAVILFALNGLLRSIGWPRLNDSGSAAAFAVSLLIAPTYLFIQQRRRRAAAHFDAEAANEAPPASTEASVSKSERSDGDRAA